jgi:hypothetical protein
MTRTWTVCRQYSPRPDGERRWDQACQLLARRAVRADVDPAALGYEVTAFITLEIRQATATIRSPNGSTHRARIVGSLPPSLVLPRALAGRCRARSAAVPRATESPSRESEVSLTREQPG